MDKTKTCKLLFTIFDNLSVGIKPPEDIVVKDRLNESKFEEYVVIPDVEIDDVIANKTLANLSFGIIKK